MNESLKITGFVNATVSRSRFGIRITAAIPNITTDESGNQKENNILTVVDLVEPKPTKMMDDAEQKSIVENIVNNGKWFGNLYIPARSIITAAIIDGEELEKALALAAK